MKIINPLFFSRQECNILFTYLFIFRMKLKIYFIEHFWYNWHRTINSSNKFGIKKKKKETRVVIKLMKTNSRVHLGLHCYKIIVKNLL